MPATYIAPSKNTRWKIEYPVGSWIRLIPEEFSYPGSHRPDLEEGRPPNEYPHLMTGPVAQVTWLAYNVWGIAYYVTVDGIEHELSETYIVGPEPAPADYVPVETTTLDLNHVLPAPDTEANRSNPWVPGL